ncbi:MAG: HypC/HybG/HupF family hydrogenase formation chaperone [Chthoniobacter sp.]|nr:HypC/HybG/HupF family hydrogenase formation chaperone [Chthoniobacter sp.]
MCLAIPGQLLEIHGDDPLLRTGRVSFSGIIKEVHLACTPEARIHDYVLVHVGFTISVIDESEAAKLTRTLAELGEFDEPAAGR